MIRKVYYIENTADLFHALNTLTDAIPCWIDTEDVEMNFRKVEILARAEDIATVERVLAPLV